MMSQDTEDEIDPEVHYANLVNNLDIPCEDDDLFCDLLFLALGEMEEMLPHIREIVTRDENTRQYVLKDAVKTIRHSGINGHVLDSFFEKLALPIASKFIEAFNAAPEPKIVFVAIIPFYQILRESIVLRQRGYTTWLLHLTELDAETEKMFSKHFDSVQPLPRNLDILGVVLRRLDMKLVHMQTQQFEVHVPMTRYVLENRGDAKSFCEFYDVLSMLIDHDVLKRLWRDAADYDFANERYIFETADAVSCRFDTRWREELREKFPAAGPMIEMHPYPLDEFIGYGQKKLSSENNRPHLVYPAHITKFEADGSVQWPTIRTLGAVPYYYATTLTGQGLDFTIYNEITHSVDDPGYKLYRELEREDPLFHFLPGIPPEQFTEVVGRYNFGINLTTADPAKMEVRDSQYDVFATKIFTFLEAGLPMIVSKELRVMANFVEYYGVGFTVSRHELDTIGERIKSFDYAAAVANIRKYNEAHSMDREIERVIAIYHQLVPEWS